MLDSDHVLLESKPLIATDSHYSEKHGGLTDADNLAYACAPCNRAKGTDVSSIAEGTRTLTGLYNPRTDKWA